MAVAEVHDIAHNESKRPHLKFLVGDEDFLPVQENCIDLAISVLGMQVCNDLGVATRQIADSLKPEGLFTAAFLSETPMSKFGRACLIAEEEREGGVSPRTHPEVHPGVLGDAASRAGLGIATIDIDRAKVRYPSAPAMVEHFRSLALTNVSTNKRQFLPRDTALAASALFQYENIEADDIADDAACQGDQEEYVQAEYEVAVLTAWKTKGKRAQRGSGVPFEQLESELLKNHPHHDDTKK